MNSYETNGAAKWDEYLTIMGAYLDCGLPNFIQERLDLPSFPAFLYHALRNWCQFWPLKPHSRVLEALFSSTKLQALASFQDLYVGLQPYDQPEQFAGGILRKTAPAVFGLLAAIELHPDKGGVWAPIGGFGVVTKAVTKLAQERNVEIRTETTATKITEEGVFFISKDGPSFLPADLVVVNADLPYATETLLSSAQHPEEVRYDWDDKYDFSSGVIAFHWSVDIELTDLKTHNVFLVASSRENAEASWSVLLDGHRDTIEPFSFYVHRASATDPTAAPAGCDAILVLVPCPTLEHQSESLGLDEAVLAYQQQFDESIISTAREAVLKRLSRLQSLKNLEQHILHEVVDTPATYADKYHLAAGTPFGISHGLRQLSITRPGAESSTHSSLFVGASSRPGNGVPLVFIGAKLVAQKALNSLVKVSS
jgi:phytoene desaturase (3,4-didehydrolycopene-forming)